MEHAKISHGLWQLCAVQVEHLNHVRTSFRHLSFSLTVFWYLLLISVTTLPHQHEECAISLTALMHQLVREEMAHSFMLVHECGERRDGTLFMLM